MTLRTRHIYRQVPKDHPRGHQPTALIAGGGLAGLAAAVYLDELGYAVTLFEKKPRLGGRAYSFIDKKTGIEIDNGQHLMIGAYHNTMELLEKVGVKHKVEMKIPTQVPLIDLNGKRHDFNLGKLPPPLHLAKALLPFGGFTSKDKWHSLKLSRHLKKIQKGSLSEPYDLTINEWLSAFDQSEWSRKNFWGNPHSRHFE